MSWDVYFLKFPDEVNSVSEIPEDYEPQPLGIYDDIKKLFSEVFPAAEFFRPGYGWGVLDTDEYSIEFSIDEEEPITSIVLQIRGGETPIDVIKKICQKTAWRAIDTSSGDFMNFDNNPEVGFNEWKEYRDKVINQEE